jgi:hypothetical protein
MQEVQITKTETEMQRVNGLHAKLTHCFYLQMRFNLKSFTIRRCLGKGV